MTNIVSVCDRMLAIPVSERDHYRGRLDAPIVLLEYGDFECTACGEVFPIFTRLLQEYGEQLCLVFRHFPIVESHPLSLQAAHATEAADIQNKFWEMHDALFQKQMELTPQTLLVLAAGIGLNLAVFETDIGSEEVIRRVGDDVAGGELSGVHETPTLFINGSRYGDAYLYTDLSSKIHRELTARL